MCPFNHIPFIIGAQGMLNKNTGKHIYKTAGNPELPKLKCNDSTHEGLSRTQKKIVSLMGSTTF